MSNEWIESAVNYCVGISKSFLTLALGKRKTMTSTL
jgi:hypothetical protein